MPVLSKDILIVASTYNGEVFIADQLDSLRTQTAAERIHLLIRDDGSTDSTVALVEAMDLDPLTVEIIRGSNCGAKNSFSAALSSIHDPFTKIMLCDQDDVWMPEKSEVAAQAIAAADPARPALYCGRSRITDVDLKPIGVTADALLGPSLHHALFQNIAPGHTMAFNQALLAVFRESFNPHAIMHDWWLYCLAAGLGTVIFDPIPHADYRLHSDNEIGYSATPWQRISSDIQRLFTEDRSQLTCQADALMAAIGPRLPPHDHAMVSAFLRQDSLRSRWNYLHQYPMIAPNGRPPWISTILFLLGRYRTSRSV